MRKQYAQSSILAALAGGAALLVASQASASNPLEYPDNGSASFSRGGAWLAVGNEPIATHYNPAGLATQKSGFSVEQQLNFNNVCFSRFGPGHSPEGPEQSNTLAGTSTPAQYYTPSCNDRASFPSTIPSISIAWRASARLGFGFAIVPPATYGTPLNAFPTTSPGYNAFAAQNGQNPHVQLPASYRFMSLNQQSTILFPTWSVGYEIVKHFRVGVGLVTGIATINTQLAAEAQSGNTGTADQVGDHASDDTLATLRTNDFFVPGVVASILWSVTPQVDVSVWGRWMDSVRTDHGTVDVTQSAYGPNGLQPVCVTNLPECKAASVDHIANPGLTRFTYPIPPEVRLGIRFHQPRGKSLTIFGDGEVRDPIHDDLFDVEVDGSYAMNSQANTVQVRFAQKNGTGIAFIEPIHVPLPPNADRWNGYIDSYGMRVGGQWNAVADKLGVRAGGWFETRSMDPAWLNVFPVGAFRYGMGGGLVFRQNFIDFSFGYQHQGSLGLNNNGNGAMRTLVGTQAVNVDDPPNATAATILKNRSAHTVNDGQVTQSANVFTLGATVRF